MSQQQSQLDYDHLREKQKELKEKERAFEEQKELQRQLRVDIDEKQKQVQLLNNEIKAKQGVVKRIQTPHHPSKEEPLGSLQDEIILRDKQIEVLNDRVLIQDHELRQMRGLRDSLDKLNSLEKELDKKDAAIAELKKKVMIQEEAIGQWIAAMDEKKQQIAEKDRKIRELSGEVEVVTARYQGQVETLEGRVLDQEVQIKELLAAKAKLEGELSRSKDEIARYKHDHALGTDKDKLIEQLNDQLLQVRQTKQEEIERLGLINESEKEAWAKERGNLNSQLDNLQKDFDKYRQDREIEDLLVVKLDVQSIDEHMLMRQETLIEDLENEKAKLEARVSQISQEYHLVLADKDQLAEKIRLFQEKCASIEQQLRMREDESSELIKQLRRESHLLKDKLASSEKAVADLQRQIEELLSQMRDELQKAEQRVDKEKERANGVERQFKRALQEKDLLEQRMKSFHDQLEGVEAKMQGKVTEIANVHALNAKLQKQLDELRAIIHKQKKQEAQDAAEQQARSRDRDAEIEVLKEMIKGIKIQLKSKDTDIQRLQIKIKRLEKTNEIRDTVMQHNQQQAIHHQQQLQQHAAISSGHAHLQQASSNNEDSGSVISGGSGAHHSDKKLKKDQSIILPPINAPSQPQTRLPKISSSRGVKNQPPVVKPGALSNYKKANPTRQSVKYSYQEPLASNLMLVNKLPNEMQPSAQQIYQDMQQLKAEDSRNDGHAKKGSRHQMSYQEQSYFKDSEDDEHMQLLQALSPTKLSVLMAADKSVPDTSLQHRKSGKNIEPSYRQEFEADEDQFIEQQRSLMKQLDDVMG